MKRPVGRPRSSEPRECLCVWVTKTERHLIKERGRSLGLSISAVARKLLVNAATAADDKDLAAIPGLGFNRAHLYTEDHPGRRVLMMQTTNELRARTLGVEWERVDLRIVYERNAGVCGICRTAVSFEEFSVDHIYPLSRGGGHVLSNLQIAHLECNVRKGAKVYGNDSHQRLEM